MLAAWDCRRKASHQLRAAEEASNSEASESFRRLAAAWTSLALQIDQETASAQAEHAREAGHNFVRTADALRERLHLNDLQFDKLLTQRPGNTKT